MRPSLAAAALWACGCGGEARIATERSLAGAGDGAQLRAGWARARLRDAARTMREAFAREGADGLLRLRLHGDEVGAFFDAGGASRASRTAPGIEPSPHDPRWAMYRALAPTPTVGFCARGARVVEAGGPEGFRSRAFVVDRLLIVGAEPDGLWGAWVEALVLTDEGWRLLPTAPYERQVEAPRRDHTDVQLWDCDIGHRPR